MLLINKMSEKTFIPSEGISDTVSEETYAVNTNKKSCPANR